jgi:TorA-specific chaperone
MSVRDFPASFDLSDTMAQAALCHWLAGVFINPPSDRDIAAYRRGPAAAWLAMLAGDEILLPGVALMQMALGGDCSDRDLAAHLGAAHARLFSGLGGPSTVAPYESAHSGSRRLYQAPASDMAALLRRHDVHVSAAWAEAPDHLSVELALLARLLATGHPDSAPLLRRLDGWVPQFAADCAVIDRTGYFAGAARALAAMIHDVSFGNDTFTALTGECDDQHHPA